MLNWIKNHKIFALITGLVLLIGLNIWIFGSNFIDQKNLLTESQLQEYNHQLSEIADQASKITSRQSSKPLSQQQLHQSLQPLQFQADQIILTLKTSNYPKTLSPNVDESLQLAEILSFTLHNYELQTQSALSSASVSQVFQQTSVNAANLAKQSE